MKSSLNSFQGRGCWNKKITRFSLWHLASISMSSHYPMCCSSMRPISAQSWLQLNEKGVKWCLFGLASKDGAENRKDQTFLMACCLWVIIFKQIHMLLSHSYIFATILYPGQWEIYLPMPFWLNIRQVYWNWEKALVFISHVIPK